MKPLRLLLVVFIACLCCLAQDAAKLPSIPEIFAPGGVTGREPETVKWSPDGTRLSYVLRDDSGDHGQLYYVDVTNGKPAVLVATEKLASLSPPENIGGKQNKDDRERERRSRYSIAGYHWASDSKHLLFDSKGQLWYYTLESGTGVQMTSGADPSGDPKFSPEGKRISYVRKHNLYVRSLSGDSRESELTFTTENDGDNILNGLGSGDVTYASATAAVHVGLHLQGQAQDTGGAGVDTLIGFTAVTGSSFNDTLTGSTEGSVLTGGDGDDLLVGVRDVMYGGPGDDTLYGGPGRDTLLGGPGHNRLFQ